MDNTIDVNGVRVSYSRDCLSGNPLGTLVFLHGWEGSGQSWKSNIADLSRVFDCIAIDLPGFGISGVPDKVWGVEEYAQFLKDFVRVLDLPVFVLVGKSFGGRVAILYASNWPNTLSHLILVAAAGIEEKDFSTRIKITLAKAGKAVFSLLGPRGMEYFRSLYYKAVKVTQDTSDYKWEVKKLVTNTDLTHTAERITVPTLIIWGKADVVLPLKVGIALNKKIKASTLKQIQGGHNAHQESIKKFNSLVERYIRGLAS